MYKTIFFHLVFLVMVSNLFRVVNSRFEQKTKGWCPVLLETVP